VFAEPNSSSHPAETQRVADAKLVDFHPECACPKMPSKAIFTWLPEIEDEMDNGY
jgi:hypothetical protein